MDSYRVLVATKIAPEALEVFASYSQVQVEVQVGLDSSSLAQIISDFDALVVRSAPMVDREVLESASRLKVIGRAGIGVDNIDVEFATQRGILVMNTPEGSTITTAEHTIALMFALVRNIPQGVQSLKSGKWWKGRLVGRELHNKVLGIIGLGNIGRVVAQKAQGLGMRVVAYDPYTSEERFLELHIERRTLEELLRESDVVTCHTPLNEGTRDLIHRGNLSLMKPGSYLINCARGGIVNEEDLAEALREGRIAGAAFDVFVQEPPPVDHPLLALENFICTPHLGASTQEAQRSIARAIAEQICRYLLYREVRNGVNFPALPLENRPLVLSYMRLGEKLGSMAAQLLQAPVERLSVHYQGEVRRLSLEPIGLAVQKGVLENFHSTVNLVNAPFLLRRHGISFRQIQEESLDFHSSIGVEVWGGGRSVEIGGTLFGKKELRVVRLNEFPLEATPEGFILVMENRDRPGVIGRVGSLLGRHGINISRLELGLDRRRNRAISFWNVDSPASVEVLEELRQLEDVISLVQVRL